MQPNIARLICTFECPKKCEKCCNKQYPDPPVISRWDYDMFILTGGEVMLYPFHLSMLIDKIKRTAKPEAKIIVYTSSTSHFRFVANKVDGVTLSLHDQMDYHKFFLWQAENQEWLAVYKGSLRLNIFLGIEAPFVHPAFKIKDRIVWLDPGPLPQGEELVRLPVLW